MRRREFLRFLGAIIASESFPEAFPPVSRTTKPDQNAGLQDYLNSIKDELDSYTNLIQSKDLFEGFKEIPDSKRIEDYNLYFSMYKAGEEKYKVPWFLLWLLHEQESGASLHPYPEQSGYVGGMQRSKYYYDEQYVAESIKGFEFLNLLPQRYSKNTGAYTNDCEEIMFAARKISEDAALIRIGNPDSDINTSFLDAQYSYCNSISARRIIVQFNRMNPLLESSWDNYKKMERLRFRNNIE
jgi:hypothetical protein